MSCALLRNQPRDVDDDASCKEALPIFYEHMRMFAGFPDNQKATVMDDFCLAEKSTCGGTFTAALQSERLQCAAPPKKDKPVVAVAPPAGAVVAAPATAPMQAGDNSGISVQTANGPLASVPQKKKDGDKAAADDDDSLTATLKDRPAPNDFPGLRLGCVKDPKDGLYCAAKRGRLVANDVDCTFFQSCCYAQYVRMQWGDLPSPDEVERKCPGSRAALNGRPCVALNN